MARSSTRPYAVASVAIGDVTILAAAGQEVTPGRPCSSFLKCGADQGVEPDGRSAWRGARPAMTSLPRAFPKTTLPARAGTSVDLDRQLEQLDHLAVPLLVLGQIHQCNGETELALRCYQEVLGLAEQAGEPQLLFPCYDGLATIYLDMGNGTQAEAYMLRAQQVCRQAGLDPNSLLVLPFLC